MQKLFGLLTVFLVSTLTVSADSQRQKLGYSEGIGAVDHRSMGKAARDTIYSCQFTALGGSLNRPWVGDDGTVYFLKKPFVKGSKIWNSNIKFDEGNPNIAVTGNGLPNHVTGDFPIKSGTTAYQYDRNPNSIKQQRLSYAIPSNPKIASKPSCLPMGSIGIALSGGVFFNALDADKRDAVANEIFDACEGHPQQQGQYHYHHNSPCFEQGNAGEHSPQLGYAFDGFGIYGARGENGQIISNKELDECHGHIGLAIDRLGNQVDEYHYHINNEFPYTLGCFKGVVDQSMLERRPSPQGDMRGDTRGGNRQGGDIRNGPPSGGGNMRGGPGGGRPDLSEAAKKLGVSEQTLMRALGPPPPNFSNAAKKLGISERKLQEAMRAAGAP
jgi:hypothetical protein